MASRERAQSESVQGTRVAPDEGPVYRAASPGVATWGRLMWQRHAKNETGRGLRLIFGGIHARAFT